jgi:formylglycine-generating enzyme required for sulfatase activity/pimeloyl-ACP methyl ester carboxylesterase
LFGLTAGLVVLGMTCLAEAGTVDHEVPARDNFSVAVFRCWCPDDIITIKGVVVLVPGYECDGRNSVNDATWTDFAHRHRFALLGCFMKSSGGKKSVTGDYCWARMGSGEAILETLKILAVKTKHPELELAPMLFWGHSAGGQFNFEFTCWKPERVIAFVVNKGAHYTVPATPETRKVPAILFIGGTDTKLRIDSISFVFDSNNRQGVPWTLAIEPNVGHELGRTQQLAQMFFDAVIPLRLSSSIGPRGRPVVLNGIKEGSGWLGDRRTYEIQPAAGELKSPRKDMVWLPNESVARQWQRFVKGDPFETVAAATPRRLAVPDPSAQERAKKLVEDVFQEEIEKADTIAARQALAKRLFQQGIETENDAAVRFVLFQMAKEMAAGANDGPTAFAAIDKMAEYFDIDPFAMKQETLAGFAKNTRTLAAHRAIAEKALVVLDEAMGDNNFEAARELGKLAFAEATKCHDKNLTQEVRSRAKDLQQTKKAFAEVEEVIGTLKKHPDDPEANAAVGKYTCLVKGDWERGLPMLAKGSAEELKALAARDLKRPTKGDEQAALADAWYELAGTEGTLTKRHAQLQAAHWYWLADSNVTGLMKTKVKKRMKALAPLVATLPVSKQIVNKIDGSVLLFVPAGKFLFGEKKVPVDLPGYYLGMYKVTNTQYKKFVDATGYRPARQWGGTIPEGIGNNPAIHVSLKDAVAYCKWAELRLPTEQEWEKGARGTDGRLYPWGNDWDAAKCQNAASKIPGRCSVFLYPEGRSPWGMYQMAGNVCERCSECICKGSSSELSDPNQFALFRRGGNNPDSTDPNLGFRVAKSVMP